VTATVMDPLRWHYGVRADALTDALYSVSQVVEHLDYYDRTNLLAFLLPDVDPRRLADCWGELTEPLEQLARLDGVAAVSLMQDRGQRAPNPVDAMDTLRGELQCEISTVIARYRTVRAAQPTVLTAVTA
jgi:hypothetical protein